MTARSASTASEVLRTLIGACSTGPGSAGGHSTANEDATTSLTVGSPGFIGPSFTLAVGHPHLLLDERYVFACVLLLLLDRLLLLGRVLGLLLVLLGRLVRHRVLLLIEPEKRKALLSGNQC